MLKWTGRDLNPKPSPCKGDVIPDLTTSPPHECMGSTLNVIEQINEYKKVGMCYFVHNIMVL